MLWKKCLWRSERRIENLNMDRNLKNQNLPDYHNLEV